MDLRMAVSDGYSRGESTAKMAPFAFNGSDNQRYVKL